MRCLLLGLRCIISKPDIQLHLDPKSPEGKPQAARRRGEDSRAWPDSMHHLPTNHSTQPTSQHALNKKDQCSCLFVFNHSFSFIYWKTQGVSLFSFVPLCCCNVFITSLHPPLGGSLPFYHAGLSGICAQICLLQIRHCWLSSCHPQPGQIMLSLTSKSGPFWSVQLA